MEEKKEIDDDAAARERPEHAQNGDSGAQVASVLPLVSVAPEASELAVATRDLQPVSDANDAVQSDSHRSASNATLSSALSRGTRPTNPFDPRVSFKNPFPKFEDSMAGFRPDAGKENEEESDNECNTSAFIQSSGTATAAVNLDWSIDTIAELKPMEFSPLLEQKASFSGGGDSLNGTPNSTANNNSKFDQFFDDEAQYKVLQTPSPLIRQQEQEREREQQNQFQYLRQSQRRQHYSASPSTSGPLPRAPTPPSTVHHSSSRRAGIPCSISSSSSLSSSNLHRRCQDAIAFCEGRVRERQRKFSRLQLPQSGSNSFNPSPAPHHKKNKNKRFRGDASEFPWKTTSKEGTSELQGIHPRTPASAGTTTGTRFRPSQSPFSVPLTPIVSADQVLRTPERNPRAAAQRKSMQNEPKFSFDGGSPISPIAPCPGTGDCSGSSSNTLLDKTILEEAEYEEEEKEEKENERHEGENDKASLSPIPRRAPVKDAPSFGSLSFSVSDEEHDKENRERQQPIASTKTSAVPGSASSWSSDSPSFTLSSSWGKAAEDSFSLRTLARLQNSAGSSSNSLSSISFVSSSLSSPPANPKPGSHSNSSSSSSSEPRSRFQTAAPASRNDKKLASPSIAQRQESFMAAIEAEARASKPQTYSSSSAHSTSSTSSSLRSSSACSNTVSIAELFQEARAMGISEPRAQWEYVQLLKKQRGVSSNL